MTNQQAPVRVLVIEDDEVDSELVRRMLAESRYRAFETREVRSLYEAFGYLASRRANVALLDLNLRESSGLATLRQFREQVPGLPVVVLSGDDQLELAVAAIGEGAMDYLVKGEVSEPLLARAICYALERAAMQRKLADAELRMGPIAERVTVCTECHSVRDDLGFWGGLEEFLGAYTDTEVHPARCPRCLSAAQGSSSA